MVSTANYQISLWITQFVRQVGKRANRPIMSQHFLWHLQTSSCPTQSTDLGTVIYAACVSISSHKLPAKESISSPSISQHIDAPVKTFIFVATNHWPAVVLCQCVCASSANSVWHRHSFSLMFTVHNDTEQLFFFKMQYTLCKSIIDQTFDDNRVDCKLKIEKTKFFVSGQVRRLHWTLSFIYLNDNHFRLKVKV